MSCWKPKKIYAIQHNVTKKIYVGSSTDVEKRYMAHMYSLRSGGHANEDMQEDFDEFGEDYSLFILDEITKRGEFRKEYEWMCKYKSHIRGIGYNYKDHVAIKSLQSYINKALIPLKEGLPETQSDVENETKEDLHRLIEDLNDSQIVYVYTLVSKLFNGGADAEQ